VAFVIASFRQIWKLIPSGHPAAAVLAVAEKFIVPGAVMAIPYPASCCDGYCLQPRKEAE
jgi:hypothetical protein